MNKLFAITCLSGLLVAANVSAFDLGSLKKAADATEEAKTKVEEVKTAAASPDQTALALVKSNLSIGFTEQQVLDELGEPVNKAGDSDAGSWFYDVMGLNESLGEKAEIASMLGVDVPGADKQIEIQFQGGKVKDMKVTEAAAEE